MASAAMMVLGLAVVVFIGFMVFSELATNDTDNEASGPSGTPVATPQGR